MRNVHHFLATVFWKLLSLLITVLILLGLLYLFLESQLPDVNALKEVQLQVPLKVFTHDGKLIAEYGEVRRTPLPIAQIPKPLINAVLATEDQRFFEHGGVDMLGLLRAALQLAITGEKSQGGSTITMQVARNFYLSRKKTYARKINEILLAMKIDRTLSKQKILELYLNKIYLGNRAYGVAAAAQIYYGKNLNQLDLAELALLAGLPKAPSSINPFVNPTAAKNRRNHVLSRMYELGFINKQTYAHAIAEPITATYHGMPVEVNAPYVGEMVRDMMVSSYGEDAYTKGYQVYTTIDSQLQTAANSALRTALLNYEQRHGFHGPLRQLSDLDTNKWQSILQSLPTVNYLRPSIIVQNNDRLTTALLSDASLVNINRNVWTRAVQSLHRGDLVYLDHTDNTWNVSQIPSVEGALVSLQPQNGAITSLVGGFDYTKSNFNRVVQAQRQPGSNFKPFIYAAALDKGYTLASIVNDAPVVFFDPSQNTEWRPQNDKGDFKGPIRLHIGLIESRNMVSIRVLQAIGIPYAVDYCSRFGFDSKKLPHELSLALGTADLTPLQIVTGYATFANGGYRITPYLMERVINAQGRTIYNAKPQIACNQQCANPAPETISPATAFLMTSVLQDVIKSGTGRGALVLNRSDLAGKTGTTNDQRDTWFSGFNADVVATAWVGFDQPRSLHEYGAQAALPMWVDFMRTALRNKPLHSMMQPDDVVSVRIDPNTGLLAKPEQDDAIFEYFRKGTEPKQSGNSSTEGDEGNSSDDTSTDSAQSLF